MAYSPLKTWLRLPPPSKPEEEGGDDEDPRAGYEARWKKQQQDDADENLKKMQAARVNVQPPPSPQGMTQPYGVPTAPSPRKPIDDDIQQSLDQYKAISNQYPRQNLGAAPQRVALPQRPGAGVVPGGAWDNLRFAGPGQRSQEGLPAI